MTVNKNYKSQTCFDMMEEKSYNVGQKSYEKQNLIVSMCEGS